MKHLLLLSVAISLMCIPAFSVAAQTPSVPILEPSFPEPHSPYTVTIPKSAKVPTAVTWLVDGSEVVTARNSQTLSLTSKGLGVEQRITASVTYEGDVPVVFKKNVRPIRTDLIVSSDSVTPPFYKGRKEASVGSRVTVHALTFEGSSRIGGSLTYLWQINGKNYNSGVPSSSNILSFETGFLSEVPVVVGVYKNDVLIDEAHTLVTLAEPEVQFYEKNPLRGLSSRALISPHVFVGEELIVRAEPYFVSEETKKATPEWKLERREVRGESDPFEVALEKGSGSTHLFFILRNLENLLQTVRGNLEVQF